DLLERETDRVAKLRLAHFQINSASGYLLPNVDIYGSSCSLVDRRFRHDRNLSLKENPKFAQADRHVKKPPTLNPNAAMDSVTSSICQTRKAKVEGVFAERVMINS